MTESLPCSPETTSIPSAIPQDKIKSLKFQMKKIFQWKKKDEQSLAAVTHNLMILVTYQDRDLVLTLHIHCRFSGSSVPGCYP